ncbi:MAG: hypothetical protein Q9163_006209 [Psora crenata]
MTISHFSIITTQASFQTMLDFYLAALGPLGYKEIIRPIPGVVGLGADGIPDFWLATAQEGSDRMPAPIHLAFSASSRSTVDDFHAAALKASGTCNGAPGLRTHYGPTYYAAFVKDPMDNNLEAMCMQA